MKKIELNLEDVRAAYNEAADGEVKKALRRMFGKTVLVENIMDAVKTYEDACELDGIEPLTIDQFSFLPEQEREAQFYEHQLNVINRVLCNGWVPDYSDSDQLKYWPYLYWDENAAGGPGFSFLVFNFDRSRSYVGARRVYPTKELAIYAGKQFISIYNKIHKPSQK